MLILFTQGQEEKNPELQDNQETTIEDNLKADNITLPDELPNEELKGTYISVGKKRYSEENIQTVKEAENQETAIVDQEFLISKVKKPIPVQEDASGEEIEEFVKNSLALISPESYEYWGWNKEMNVLLFFQKKNERPIYFNTNGIIMVFLNEENEITFYTQTMLGEVEQQKGEQTLSTPIEAINVLYQENELRPNTEITKVDIGYYTRITLENVTQVFTPTWKITTDNGSNYFVDAIEASIFSRDVIEFLAESIPEVVEKVNQITNNPDLKEYFLSQLTDRLAKVEGIEAINRGESE